MVREKLVSGKSKKARASAQSRAKKRNSPRNTVGPAPRTSAKSRLSESGAKSRLTRPKKRPGPKSQLFGNTVLSADHAYKILNSCADDLHLEALTISSNEMEIEAALWKIDEPNRAYVLRRWSVAILMWVKEKRYPKKNRQAILRHLADSIAGEGNVSPRRSRDICSKLRREVRSVGKIIRREFYVECTCGYRGPARHDACPDCGAPVPLFKLGETGDGAET